MQIDKGPDHLQLSRSDSRSIMHVFKYSEVTKSQLNNLRNFLNLPKSIFAWQFIAGLGFPGLKISIVKYYLNSWANKFNFIFLLNIPINN